SEALMLFSTWILPQIDPQASRLLQREHGIPALVADLLAGRGLRPHEVADLLDGSGELEDPFALPDMGKAAVRLEDALSSGERIAVFGDYDCDGVTATVMLYSYLCSMGADAVWYIPDRLEEGYGMNKAALDKLKEQGVRLIITVDNGISALDEAEYAASLGMDLIITDHHQPGPQLPRAAAVVDPHRKDCSGCFTGYCGAGVALMLISAMEEGDWESVLETFGPLAAVATVGDVVPLRGANRVIVSQGLQRLPYTDSPGLRALLSVSGLADKPVTASRVAFGLAPRINAAGRMGSAALAARLLLCEDEEEAEALAQELDALNTRRREEEEEILSKITALIDRSPELLLNRVLVLAEEGLNHGVVGIVSARILSLYGKPNVILSIEGDKAVGSARSLGDFSMFKAISACAPLLTKFGGHALAAGVTLPADRIGAFSQTINQYAARYHDRMPRDTIRIDRRLRGVDISLDTVDALELLEPFGEGNPQPVFLMQGCVIRQLVPMGGGKHLKLKVDFDGKQVYVVCFRTIPESFIYSEGSRVDLLVTLELNEYRGSRGISVRMKDIRPSDFAGGKMENADYFYEKIRRGEPVQQRVLELAEPTVPELRELYKKLRARFGDGSPLHTDLYYLAEIAPAMNYCKYRLSLDILREMGLIRIPPDFSTVELVPVSGRIQIESSAILSAVRQMRGHSA
ncbi:MAG: single-stranded-DNA-specific exonuclease RecJ, partial [Oscillospiraceae bacterium]|nr:single-stranded-DNA-specific exonuclease RecJ [Oscillospiraceae bacterium]